VRLSYILSRAGSEGFYDIKEIADQLAIPLAYMKGIDYYAILSDCFNQSTPDIFIKKLKTAPLPNEKLNLLNTKTALDF